MTGDVLTVGELKDALDGLPDDTEVNVQRAGALGEATGVYRTVEGVKIRGR